MEKEALELYYKFYNILEHKLSEEYSPFEKEIMKECELITIDKIIIALNYNHWQNSKQIDYFIEVRQEIEKL